MSSYSKLARVGVATSASGLLLYLLLKEDKRKSKKEDDGFVIKAKTSKKSGNRKVKVDKRFMRQLLVLLKILVPGPFSSEAGYLSLVAVMMVARTYCDVFMVSHAARIERFIIDRDAKGFRFSLLYFFVMMFPISMVNNLLKYGLWELAIRFRSRLTKNLFEEYMKGYTYYGVTNLDARITNADQLLTQDVEKFCQSIADLYSNLSKPVLDILIYARKLHGNVSFLAPATMLAYLAGSGVFLTNLRAPVGRLTVREQQLEGEFRFVNSRLITNSEEIAFYNGNKKEASVIKSSFRRLYDHLRKAMKFRFTLGVVDNIVAKYFATVVGYLVVSRAFLDKNNPRYLNMSKGDIMEDYYKTARMMMNLSTAVGRLVLAGRELTRLAGFTERVTELRVVLKDLNSGKYERTMVSGEEKESASALGLVAGAGKIVKSTDVIRFDKVPLVTPNGDVLVRELSFEVNCGTNVLVAGPNGCGKSSLFRVLGELWPLFGGTLHKPSMDQLFYIPQRPYLALGTLRDQVIYPHSVDDLQRLGITDDQLVKYLEDVQLTDLLDREGGWDAIQDWADVLSGGQKQRIGMARMFYHKPKFAILDECTSAVSVDVEGFMYNHSRELGMTLFTVSHRKSLWKYHEYVLHFDGRGSYEFRKNDDTNVFGS